MNRLQRRTRIAGVLQGVAIIAAFPAVALLIASGVMVCFAADPHLIWVLSFLFGSVSTTAIVTSGFIHPGDQ